MMNCFAKRNFIQPMGRPIMLSGCLGFFPFKFGGGGGGFIFLSANGKAQDALLLFLLSWGVGGGQKDFFPIFPCFPMCSDGVSCKFLMGSQYVPQVHNVFLNMFSI